MRLFWSALIILVGLFMFVSALRKSNFIIYRCMVARSRILWGEKVYLFHKISGIIIFIFGVLYASGVIAG